MRAPWWFFLAYFSVFVSSFSADVQLSGRKNFSFTASLSTTWHVHDVYDSSDSVYYGQLQDVRLLLQPILVRETTGSAFGCGFYCNPPNCPSVLFAVFIIPSFYPYRGSEAVVVWSANRDHTVGVGAILNFTAAGELVLKDVDGSIIWTTNTAVKSVAGMNLTGTGNLVLYDVHNSIVWQSFDHPTDCLLPGQKKVIGLKWIPSVSETNWTAQQGLYSLQLTNKGLRAYVGSSPPQLFYYIFFNNFIGIENQLQLTFIGGSMQIQKFNSKLGVLPTYVKLMPDGHLKLFEWSEESSRWTTGTDLFDIDVCDYPLACGRNAICTANQQCSCPTTYNSSIQHFTAVNYNQPNLGCSEVTPLTCNATSLQEFILLKNVKYFTLYSDMANVTIETCKQACLHNCSCKAVVFQYYGANSLRGFCYLPSELLTMMYKERSINALTFIKVQNPNLHPLSSPHPSSKRKNRVATIEASTIGSFVFLLVIVVAFIACTTYRRKRNVEMDEEYLDQVPGLPTRFSYHVLENYTENFSKKLGEGGFGSVFEGTLEDGFKIAVKRLDSLSQVKKSFQAEVECIGSIHHLNLVRLIGFSAWKSQRLLVYEFMSNGSLDRWIYHGDRQLVLSWECRKRIVLDIAKGLAYLHEECRQKIIHLDIKPQNILLDDDFNAKVSDFGLSKLVDKDQSNVMTTMRGTPGYMAPEWLSSIITEKVDVYSFGIVLLEILCGRKNFDRCQPEESWHLLKVFENCWEQGKMLDLVDPYSEDMQAHGTEVVETMKLASWCLQTDFKRRPSMSTVIKVISDGVMTYDVDLDYNFSVPRRHRTISEHKKDSTPLPPSVLSQPR